MKAVFKDCIQAGKIQLPAYLQDSFSGIVTVTIDDQGASNQEEASKDAAAVDWFQSMLGTVAPFEPLSRQEANERNPE